MPQSTCKFVLGIIAAVRVRRRGFQPVALFVVDNKILIFYDLCLVPFLLCCDSGRSGGSVFSCDAAFEQMAGRPNASLICCQFSNKKACLERQCLIPRTAVKHACGLFWGGAAQEDVANMGSLTSRQASNSTRLGGGA